jgi:hypothetical protein
VELVSAVYTAVLIKNSPPFKTRRKKKIFHSPDRGSEAGFSRDRAGSTCNKMAKITHRFNFNKTGKSVQGLIVPSTHIPRGFMEKSWIVNISLGKWWEGVKSCVIICALYCTYIYNERRGERGVL